MNQCFTKLVMKDAEITLHRGFFAFRINRSSHPLRCGGWFGVDKVFDLKELQKVPVFTEGN